MNTSQAWHLAAVFPGGTTARAAWQTAKSAAERLNSTATAANLMYRSSFCVVVYAPGEAPPANLQQEIEAIFKRYKGEFIILPDATMKDLLERRTRRREDGKPGEAGLVYESHTPQAALSSESTLTREENEPHLRAVVKLLADQGLPFIEIYKTFLHVNFQVRLDVMIMDRVEEYIYGLGRQLDGTHKYIFTHSARAMQKAVYEPLSAWTLSTEPVATRHVHDGFMGGIWIEQDEAQPFPALDTKIKAVWIQPRHDPDFKPLQQVVIIDELTRHQFTFIFDVEKGTYEPTVDYECRWNECRTVKQPLDDGYLSYYREACPRCKEEMQIWIHWLHTAGRMLRRDFATSPDPEEWKKRQISWQEKKLVPRHHGKGKPKEKMVESRATYSVITYEVSEKPFVPRFEEEEIEPHEKAQNWLTTHSKGDIIYERREVAAYTREYRKERFNPLKTEVAQAGGKLVKKVVVDGEEELREIVYTVEQRGNENVVVGTMAGYQKYIPMLRPEARKQQTIKKVTAKKYES